MNYGGDNYKAWKVNSKDFPKDKKIEDQILFLLRYAILAPSTFNSQPWKCRVNEDTLIVYLDTKRVPERSDKTGRFSYITIGCFLENLITASNYYNVDTRVIFSRERVNRKGLEEVATVVFKKDGNRKIVSENNFLAITRRVTNRSLSKKKNIPKYILEEVPKFKVGGEEIVLLDKKIVDKIVNISKNADLSVWSDNDFRKEHVGWVRNNLTKKYDGMPGFGVGVGLIASFFARPIILSPLFAKLQSKKNVRALQSSSNYIALCSKDNIVEWVRVGMLYERISLFLTFYGVCTSPMGQFIENEEARRELSLIVEAFTHNKPQIFFRIGYPTSITRHSPRYSVESILL